MPARRLSHVVGFDDAPFERDWRGDVDVIGAVFADLRLDGVLRTRVRRDGANATERLAETIDASRFRPQLHAVLLQGIALAGFNVIDIHALSARLSLPVLVVARRRPDLDAIEDALRHKVPGGLRKWRLIERAGPMEPTGGVFIQRVGMTREVAAALVTRLQLHSRVPEPLRVAHLVAGALARGESRGPV